MHVRSCLLATLLLLLLPGAAHAASFGIVDEFLAGARGTGLAGAYTATAEGPYAVDWNPAGLAFVRGTQAGYYRREAIPDLTDREVSFRGLGISHGNGRVGVGLFRADLEEGNLIAEGELFGRSEENVQVGVGLSLFDLLQPRNDPGALDVAVGVNLKKVRARYPMVLNDEATAFDLGVLTRWGQVRGDEGPGHGQLRFGFAYDDVLEAEDAVGDPALSSRSYRLGAAWERAWADGPRWREGLHVMAAVDFRDNLLDDDRNAPQELWSLGFEIGWEGLFSARTGYYHDEEGDITDWAWSLTADVRETALPVDLQVSAGQFPQATGLDRVWFFGVNALLGPM